MSFPSIRPLKCGCFFLSPSREERLPLLDLAGSERLEKSGAGNDKDRLKETRNINKSLSALGDVIATLDGKGDGKSDKHIPYRNSKVTLILATNTPTYQ